MCVYGQSVYTATLCTPYLAVCPSTVQHRLWHFEANECSGRPHQHRASPGLAYIMICTYADASSVQQVDYILSILAATISDDLLSWPMRLPTGALEAGRRADGNDEQGGARGESGLWQAEESSWPSGRQTEDSFDGRNGGPPPSEYSWTYIMHISFTAAHSTTS